MRDTLKSFTKQSLTEASGALLHKLGIQFTPLIKDVELNDIFKVLNFIYQYVNEAQAAVKSIWHIGFIDDRTFPENVASGNNSLSPGISIYACEIKPNVDFPRGLAAALTRAFTRVNTRQINSNIDIPVVVIMKQGALLTLSTCELIDRLDGNGKKIGKVTMLRDMDCNNLHAGHKQIMERIAKDVSGCNSYDDLHKRWFKSFSIDVLSDKFFKEYKAIYEDIIEYVTGKRMVYEGNRWIEHDNGDPCIEIMKEFSGFPDPEKAVRDYVKNLMGRLVFIQFLQKKGWMGVPAGDSWKDGEPEFLQNLFKNSDKKETFIDDVLKPLFNDLNTKRHGDLVTNHNVSQDRNIKVPYLNGGLFELDKSDDTAFPLPPSYMQKLLDFFASYNFTIDENAPDDVEIGVDPEMLGRIFENLLEDNKEKGAYYTPKEIVQYLCRESLIAYLQTPIEDAQTREAIRQFTISHDPTVLTDEIKATIDQRLTDVKICDPAIGSGAFPMGLLHELYSCRKAIEGIKNEDAVNIKKHIIQNNIYGVDIEKGAVDIARLRFWLALIVDEETPEALPNLDFKIMQGNSLLEQYEGVDLSGVSLNEQASKKAKKQTKQGQGYEQTIVFDEQGALNNIHNALRQYYGTDDHDSKIKLRDAINVNVKDYILKLKGCTPEIKEKLKSLPIPNDKFFLWHIYFNEVFSKGGFDIVIGNPPFIDSETMVRVVPKERELYSLKYDCARGNWDMFIVFIELGITLLKESGIFSNIIPNKLIAAKYAVKLRNLISTKHVIEIRDYSRIDVFEDAAVYPITLVLRNKFSDGNTSFAIMSDRIKVNQKNIAKSSEMVKIDYWDVFFRDKNVFNLMNRINQNKSLKSFPIEVIGAATVSDAYEIKKIVKEDDGYIKGFKLINSGTIDPYHALYGIKPCRYIKDIYLHPKVPSDSLKNYSEVRFQQASSAKIIVASMTTRYEACLDINGEFIAGKSTTIVLGSNEDLYFIIGIINSKLASFWLNIQFNSLKMAGGAINIGKNEIQLLPIPDKRMNFKRQIDSIIKSKQSNPQADTKALEHEIDRRVYELYGLTNGEVKIIDPTEAIIGSNNELFKA